MSYIQKATTTTSSTKALWYSLYCML
uniref:Uncharacterized protein n=1 Tax=Rhizophora mucronata TaxID=61149 RepID=A0A2P2N2L1_RHIMU